MARRIMQFFLTRGMNTEGQLYRVKKDSAVHFVPDFTLIGGSVRFFINYPDPSSGKFLRSAYREIRATNPTNGNKQVDCFDNYFELFPLVISGSFHFYFTCDGSFPPPPDENNSNSAICGSGYLTVDPHFSGNSDQPGEITDRGWDLDGVVLQTYLSKNLGPFKHWDAVLQAAKEGHYNMIHFTPVQELGYSHSAYSLRDQLKVNPEFSSPGSSPVDWPDIERFIQHLENDWSILSMADLVLNHTSNDSPWVHEHPECAYNVVNSPHLVPAYLLDVIVWCLSEEVSSGALANRGIPAKLENPANEIPAMRAWLSEKIEQAKLHEFFTADVDTVRDEFVSWLLSGKSSIDTVSFRSGEKHLFLKVAGLRRGRRHGATVDFEVARREYVGVCDHSMPLSEAAAHAAADQLRAKLLQLNADKKREVDGHIEVAIQNVLANASYRFYDSYGLKLGTVTMDTPIMWKYFYHPKEKIADVHQAEALLNTCDAPRIMAFNGWVMGDDPLRNFAESNSNVYLRRELIVWGDSVKLRYGSKPEDCPYLWDRMTKYAEMTARIFHAVRLDNCHSTPLHVAQYLLDRARAVRPNLYVVAELFTGSEHVDNIFINKLGLNSLIRESLSAHSCSNFGSQLHRFGVTRPAGAFFNQTGKHRLYPSVAHALLYDQTHDNQSVVEKHCVFNFLPISALNALSCCAIGSTRGYDELVPHNIDVVNEKRCYSRWPQTINDQTGLVEAKSVLNELHSWLSYQGFSETFVDQVTENVIAITRICPQTRESVVAVAHCAFHQGVADAGHQDFHPIQLGGQVNRLLFEIQTIYGGSDRPEAHFKRRDDFINGLPDVKFSILANVEAKTSQMFRVEPFTNAQGMPLDQLCFHNFLPGSIVVVSVRLTETQEKALSSLHELMRSQFSHRLMRQRLSVGMGSGKNAYMPRMLPSETSVLEPNELRIQVSNLNLVELNWAMFRCEAEERVEEPHCGAYDIPGFGKLCYCGFQSIASVLEDVRSKNDLGHPVCCHLRNGDWLAHYLAQRLCNLPPNSKNILTEDLVRTGKILHVMFSRLNELPRYLTPAYFEALITAVRDLIANETIHRMANWIRGCSSLVKRLALATNQFYGYIGNCVLPPAIPFMPTDMGLQGSQLADVPLRCSLSAGLPHFAEGMWRSWGRDTFIALRGCMLLTERFDEAASIILSYASLVRHGLIPNLTGDGKDVHPRYNCRDAVWFWLYSIMCYDKIAKNSEDVGSTPSTEDNSDNALIYSGKQVNTHSAAGGSRISWFRLTSRSQSILERPVWRWFPSDNAAGWPVETPERRNSVINARVQPLHEVVQEVLQRHISGIEFTERNAGSNLDEHMKPEGFKVTASVDPNTGFPCGGNAFNCGTWMDKMGSSDRAGNRGKPATPRDGSAVELVGLAYAVVCWLEQMHQTSSPTGGSCYPHSGVQLPDGKYYTWGDWLERLKRNFERYFWIPSDTTDPSLAYNRGIYRDSVGSSAGYTDNQLRPNFLVTMVVAPQMFTPERAWHALDIAKEKLVGPLGIRTLSDNDMAYRGNYDNSNDGTDFAIARGFNYHQGPEWLWPTGYYLRARMLFARILSEDPKYANRGLVCAAIAECQTTLSRLDHAILSSQWYSLPELTNANGQYCRDSCEAQAWSIGCALEAAYDLLFPPPI
ncbi:Glycogen debranching enzyme [Fasciola hepatica]|uniref:Glycogen debranching enzyme n=1 Tax=Fasciola hepatica TaxID=6192 RepID=A0A4E0R8L3_FASHE|nr:Glycogen debranching enzyme [Fasciola hepatica]